MKIVKLGKDVKAIPRVGIVYDNEEEFRSREKSPSMLWSRGNIHDNRDKIRIGHFFLYDDGKISKILRIREYRDFSSVRTIANELNTIKIKHSTDTCNSTDNFGKWGAKPKEDTLQEVDDNKRRFVELWLFNGLTMEEAIRATLFGQFKMYWKTHRLTATQSSLKRIPSLDGPLRKYAAIVLNAPWFDKLLAQDRVIRDRYMSFIGAMESVGLTKERIAEIVKTALESENERERINALNRVLDIVQIEEAKRPRQGMINATYRDVDEEARHLDTQPVKSLPPPQPTEVPINASPKEVSEPSREVLSGEEAAENLRGEVRVAEGETGRSAGAKAEYRSHEEALLEITEEEIRNVAQSGK